MDWEGLEQDLQEFEREKWGTNDWTEIRQRIWKGEERNRLRRNDRDGRGASRLGIGLGINS